MDSGNVVTVPITLTSNKSDCGTKKSQVKAISVNDVFDLKSSLAVPITNYVAKRRRSTTHKKCDSKNTKSINRDSAIDSQKGIFTSTGGQSTVSRSDSVYFNLGRRFQFSKSSFDRILLDPPCSALGLRPRLAFRSSDTNVKTLEWNARQQRHFLANAVVSFAQLFFNYICDHVCYIRCLTNLGLFYTRICANLVA